MSGQDINVTVGASQDINVTVGAGQDVTAKVEESQDINVTISGAISLNYVAAGTKLYFDGAGGNTYLVYNAATKRLELYVEGVQQKEWGVGIGGLPW